MARARAAGSCPGQVGGVDHFVERHAEGVRQALATQFRCGGEAGPAAVDELRVGLLEAGRGGDLAGGLVEHAADFVTHAVERRQHGGAEAAGFLEHGVHHVGGGVGEAEAGEQGFDLEHVMQGETDIGKRCGVAAHRQVSIRCKGGAGGARVSAARRAGRGLVEGAAAVDIEAAQFLFLRGGADRALERIGEGAVAGKGVGDDQAGAGGRLELEGDDFGGDAADGHGRFGSEGASVFIADLERQAEVIEDHGHGAEILQAQGNIPPAVGAHGELLDAGTGGRDALDHATVAGGKGQGAAGDKGDKQGGTEAVVHGRNPRAGAAWAKAYYGVWWLCWLWVLVGAG